MKKFNPTKDVHELTELQALIGLIFARNWEEHDYFASYGGVVSQIAEKGRKLMQDPELQAAYKHDHTIDMLIDNCSIEDIVKETGLSIEEINEIRKELK